jgi:hypothetical protein
LTSPSPEPLMKRPVSIGYQVTHVTWQTIDPAGDVCG